MRHWNCGNIGHGTGQSVSNVNFWITLKYFMSPLLICIESEFTRAFDQSLVVISSRWRRWRSDQQAAAVPPRLYSVLGCCTAVLLSSTPAPTLWSSTGAAARETWSQVTQCYNTISCDFDTVSGDHFDTCGRGEGQNKWFGSILLSLLVMDSLFQIDVNTNHGVGRFLTGHQCWLGLYPLS